MRCRAAICAKHVIYVTYAARLCSKRACPCAWCGVCHCGHLWARVTRLNAVLCDVQKQLNPFLNFDCFGCAACLPKLNGLFAACEIFKVYVGEFAVCFCHSVHNFACIGCALYV